ncbi:MAG: YdcF family protein [Rhodocyclaceae bacterium]|nr:YdcF family protein [Rhodocyclaceae bacterium]MBX3667823.1 YdcF family protein [Rhodocyclaceae bacterium]
MENFAFVLKKILSTALLPPAAPILLGMAGLLLARRRRRLGLGMAWAALLSLFLLSLPVVADYLERSASWPLPADLAALRGTQAVVILGGGAYRRLLDYEGENVNAYSLERVRAGARLARELQLPILVSGGVVWEGRPEAELMQLALADFGSRARWLETQSRDTHDNAVESARILKQAGIVRVALVTHAFHMLRAMREFRLAGLEPVAAPTIVRRDNALQARDFAPSAGALSRSEVALHELLGQWAARLRGVFPG